MDGTEGSPEASSQNLCDRLSLGTAQVAAGYGATRATASALGYHETNELLGAAWTLGIRHIDTAPDYGAAEQLLGQIGIDDWKVSTKIKAPPVRERDIRSWVHKQIEGSLSRLGIARLDTVLLHRPEIMAFPEGRVLLDALAELRESNTIARLGASVYGPGDLGNLLATRQLDTIQAPISVVDRRMLSPSVTRLLREHGYDLQARSVFLQGLLLIEPAARPKWARRFDSALATWDAWSSAHDIGRAQLCLSYVLGRPEIARVVIGVESMTQLTQVVPNLTSVYDHVPASVGVEDTTVLDPRCWPRGRRYGKAESGRNRPGSDDVIPPSGESPG